MQNNFSHLKSWMSAVYFNLRRPSGSPKTIIYISGESLSCVGSENATKLHFLTCGADLYTFYASLYKTISETEKSEF